MKPYFIGSRVLEIHLSNIFREKMLNEDKMMEESCEHFYIGKQF